MNMRRKGKKRHTTHKYYSKLQSIRTHLQHQVCVCHTVHGMLPKQIAERVNIQYSTVIQILASPAGQRECERLRTIYEDRLIAARIQQEIRKEKGQQAS